MIICRSINLSFSFWWIQRLFAKTFKLKQQKNDTTASLFMDGRKQSTESEADEKLLQFRPHEKACFAVARMEILVVEFQIQDTKLGRISENKQI